jgi:hypothetical protein
MRTLAMKEINYVGGGNGGGVVPPAPLLIPFGTPFQSAGGTSTLQNFGTIDNVNVWYETSYSCQIYTPGQQVPPDATLRIDMQFGNAQVQHVGPGAACPSSGLTPSLINPRSILGPLLFSGNAC